MKLAQVVAATTEALRTGLDKRGQVGGAHRAEQGDRGVGHELELGRLAGVLRCDDVAVAEARTPIRCHTVLRSKLDELLTEQGGGADDCA